MTSKQISKNYEIDTYVRNVEHLGELAAERKGVYCTFLKRIQPASWLITMPARTVLEYIKQTTLFTIKRIERDTTTTL
jgi:hypothetical protein